MISSYKLKVEPKDRDIKKELEEKNARSLLEIEKGLLKKENILKIMEGKEAGDYLNKIIKCLEEYCRGGIEDEVKKPLEDLTIFLNGLLRLKKIDEIKKWETVPVFHNCLRIVVDKRSGWPVVEGLIAFKNYIEKNAISSNSDIELFLNRLKTEPEIPFAKKDYMNLLNASKGNAFAEAAFCIKSGIKKEFTKITEDSVLVPLKITKAEFDRNALNFLIIEIYDEDAIPERKDLLSTPINEFFEKKIFKKRGGQRTLDKKMEGFLNSKNINDARFLYHQLEDIFKKRFKIIDNFKIGVITISFKNSVKKELDNSIFPELKKGDIKFDDALIVRRQEYFKWKNEEKDHVEYQIMSEDGT